MNNYEQDYKNLIQKVLDEGDHYDTRSGDTTSIFGQQLKIDSLRHGRFPLITGRKMYPKGIFGELAAMVRGPKHIDDFTEQGCNFWGAWAKEDGSINVDYGNKWLDFNGVNQIEVLLDGLKNNPYGRRHIINAWDPSTQNDVDLPCCHYCYQFQVDRDGYLNLVWIQRSVDVMIGLVSDVAVAAAMVVSIANEVGLKPGTITMQFGDTHIYNNHLEKVEEYLERDILPLPRYKVLHDTKFSNFYCDDITLVDYECGEPIKFEVAV